MKEQLLGRPAKPAPVPVVSTAVEEEVKHAAPVKEDLNTNEAEEKSFDS